jgi:Protein of unknown function (DUF2851)
MNESFLYYIWQLQYFDKNDLEARSGEKIEVFNPGTLNTHSGPDFSNAKVMIDGISWAGNVEIHTRSSDWREHHHDTDEAYENVILHVVWQDDLPVYRNDKTILPTLELKSRIDESLIHSYKKLVHNPFTIPCQNSFPRVDEVLKVSMLDRALMQRLESKAGQVIDALKQNNHDWEETAYQLLARNFGFKVNNEAFQRLGRSLPYKILLKHGDKPVQIEALMFGQAGFMDIAIGDEYYKVLRREYKVLGQKYGLYQKKLARAQWRFLRLRPANFPTVRLAQFSALVQKQRNIFSKIIEAQNYESLFELFSVHQSDYWRRHYQFNRKAKQLVPVLGKSSIDNILLNTVTPLLVAYGKFNDLQHFVDRAGLILQFVPAESNAIIKAWKEVGYSAKTSFDSQGLIELYNNYCQRRNCLNCSIGASLVKPRTLT